MLHEDQRQHDQSPQVRFLPSVDKWELSSRGRLQTRTLPLGSITRNLLIVPHSKKPPQPTLPLD